MIPHPPGKSLNLPISCPALFAKIYFFSLAPNQIHKRRRLVPLEGRIAIVTNAGRDAVDADVLRTNGTGADGEVVWF